MIIWGSDYDLRASIMIISNSRVDILLFIWIHEYNWRARGWLRGVGGIQTTVHTLIIQPIGTGEVIRAVVVSRDTITCHTITIGVARRTIGDLSVLVIFSNQPEVGDFNMSSTSYLYL